MDGPEHRGVPGGILLSLMPTERPLLKIKVHGPGFKPGRIPVPLLVKICSETQTAVNRQAQALEGKKTLRPGPVVANVSRECTLELIGLKKGSTTLNFAQAAQQPHLGYMPSMSVAAASGVGTALKAVSARRKRADVLDIGVLDSLNNLGEVFEKGVVQVDWIVPAHNGSKKVAVRFVPELRAKIAARIQKPMESASTTVEGTLELTEGKCRISPVVGTPILCGFEQDKAEGVYEAMRKPVKVQVDTRTRRIKELEITGQPDALGGASFFSAKTIDQLIAEQRVHPITDLSVLCGAVPDEDVDGLVAEIYRGREI